jgi:hypothetical protein
MANHEQTDERRCGWTEDKLLLWLDGDLHGDDAADFAAHLDGCAACSRDRVVYADLFDRLSALAAPAVPVGFDATVLAALSKPSSVPSRPVGAPLVGRGWRRPAALTPRRLRGAALVGAAVLVVLAWAAFGIDWSLVAGRAVQPVAHLGARAAADGALSLLGAVTVSESFIEIAGALEPVGRSIVVVARAFQAEILLVSLLLALTAFVAAVRLAAGSVVERGVRRVCLALSI